MRRLLILAGLLIVGGLAIVTVGTGSRLSAQQAEARVIDTEEVRDNLFVLRGGGGNTAAFIGPHGVTLVDTKIPGWGQTLLDSVSALTDRPVTTLINTHSHFDHVGGNPELPVDIQIVAHENSAANMLEMRPVTGFGPQNMTFEGDRGMPTDTFTDRFTLGGGDARIELYYFGRAHTNGDIWVVFPSLSVMHGGDAFSGKNLPIMDANNGGSALEFPATLRKVIDAIEVETIITGHSTLMTMDDLREYADFTLEFLGAMRAAKAAGQSAEEAAESWTPSARFEGYAVPEARLLANVQTLFSELP
ncbi:MAG: MBL fold metallo-hydrolase [Acidobacteria bacterium]|nr:MBL fold metallo-hydrolase [Acidobacteriota bacterium]